jgi:hypothetical protein
MERVQSMDKYTVLSELKKFVSKPIKVTDININRDIFEVPEEKINKTSILYSVKDGKKNVYIPIEQKEEQLKDTVDDSTIKRLLKTSGKGKQIAAAYLQQEETKEGVLSVLNKLLLESKPKVDVGKELIKKEKERTKQPLSTAIVPVVKKEVEEIEVSKKDDSDSENEDLETSKNKYKKYQQRVKRKLLIPIIDNKIEEIKVDNPDITKEQIKALTDKIVEAIPEGTKDEDIQEKVDEVVEKSLSQIMSERGKKGAAVRPLVKKGRELVKKNIDNIEELIELIDTDENIKAYITSQKKKSPNKRDKEYDTMMNRIELYYKRQEEQKQKTEKKVSKAKKQLSKNIVTMKKAKARIIGPEAVREKEKRDVKHKETVKSVLDDILNKVVGKE